LFGYGYIYTSSISVCLRQDEMNALFITWAATVRKQRYRCQDFKSSKSNRQQL